MDFSLTWSGPVAVATWNDGENRINTDSLGAFNAILDDVVATTGPRASMSSLSTPSLRSPVRWRSMAGNQR